jgi:hypothetical protein
VVKSGRPGKDSVAEVVSSLTGKYAIAVAWQCGGRQHHCNGETFRARGYAVSTVGCEAEHLRRYLRNQELLAIQGRNEDGDCEESLRTFIWQALGLLTTVKPSALRERHDFC